MEKHQAIVGKKYVVTGGDVLTVGDVVTYKGDDDYSYTTSGGEFVAANGAEHFKYYSNVEPATPAVLAGFEIGKQYVMNGTGEHYALRKGDVVTFYEDDASILPFFTATDGKTHSVSLYKLTPYVAPVELAFEQQAVPAAGDKFVVMMTDSHNFHLYEVVTFEKMDTILYGFRNDSGSYQVLRPEQVAPYVAPYVEPVEDEPEVEFKPTAKIVANFQGTHIFIDGYLSAEKQAAIEAVLAI